MPLVLSPPLPLSFPLLLLLRSFHCPLNPLELANPDLASGPSSNAGVDGRQRPVHGRSTLSAFAIARFVVVFSRAHGLCLYPLEELGTGSGWDAPAGRLPGQLGVTEASGTRACGQGEVSAGGLRGAREKAGDRARGSCSGSQEVPKHLFVYIGYELSILWFCFCYFGFPILIRRSQKDVRGED